MSNTVIRTNVSALTSHRNLTSVSRSQSTASARLSSGKKINSAADDAAGLAISSKMQAQIKGLDMASKNAEDAISLIQTADGSFSEIDNMVQRIRELTVQAANDTNTIVAGEGGTASPLSGEPDIAGSNATQGDRYKIGLEVAQLMDEIDQIAARTEFNTKKLAMGKYASVDPESGEQLADEDKISLQFQIGANSEQRISLNINAMTTGGTYNEDSGALAGGLALRTAFDSDNALGVVNTGYHDDAGAAGDGTFQGFQDQTSDVASAFAALSSDDLTKALDKIDAAVAYVAIERSNLGAVQNRLDYTNNNLKISSENLSSAKSTIADADMGKEMMNLTSANVLQQAATSMLAQANQGPQNILQLIQ